MGLTGARFMLLAIGLPVLLLVALLTGLSMGAAGFDAELIAELRAPRVAAAAGVGALLALAGLAMQVLAQHGIRVGAHISSIADAQDDYFNPTNIPEQLLASL